MRSTRSIVVATVLAIIVVLALGPFNGFLEADAARGGRPGPGGQGNGSQRPGTSSGDTSTTTGSTSTTTPTGTVDATPSTSTAGPGSSVDPDSTSGSLPSTSAGPWRGAFLPHGWVATAKSETHIRGSVAALRDAAVTEQIHNVGKLDGRGLVPESDYSGLARWVAVSRDAAPEQRIYAWVNGTAVDHVERPEVHGAIARGLRSMVMTHRLDGVVLDLEPFGRDDPRYLSLLRAVRAELPDAWIGVTAPLDRWTGTYITEAGRSVDALMPMTYDTEITAVPDYVASVAASLSRYRSALASSSARLIPILPAYSANPWHDPAIENIRTAWTAVSAAGGAEGAAVYWWWEMTADDIAAWRDVLR